MNRFPAVKTLLIVGIILLIVVIAGAAIALFRSAETAAQQMQSNASMCRICSAFRDYIIQENSLPASISAEAGSPHSWRTQVEQAVFGKSSPKPRIDFSMPWNSPENIAAAEHPDVDFHYRRPRENLDGVPTSDFFAVVGERTAFPEERGLQLEAISDGLENTVLVIEVEGSQVPWTRPYDIPFEDLRMLYDSEGEFSLDVPHLKGVGLIFADLAAYRLTRRIPFEVFQSLFTVAGFEEWTRLQLVEQGYLVQACEPLLTFQSQELHLLQDRVQSGS